MKLYQTSAVSKRLREQVLSRYESLAEFARSLGMKAQTLNDYLSGRSLPGNKLQARLRELGFDVEFIMTGKQTAARMKENFGKVSYPLVSHIRAGSGTVAGAVTAFDVQSKRAIQGPTDPAYKGALFFEVRGKSMEPRWEEGDLVLVHPGFKPKNGDYGVICWEREEGALKKIFYQSGKIMLQSINPLYESILVDPREVWFLGKVLWTKHKS